MIAVQMFTLADQATIREGLISVLAAGLSEFRRELFPAKVELVNAIVLELNSLISAHEPIQTRVDVEVIDFASGNLLYNESFTMNFTPLENEIRHAQTFPLVGRLAVELPKPGDYQIRMRIDGEVAATADFAATLLQSHN